jgi:hypothetical protein
MHLLIRAALLFACLAAFAQAWSKEDHEIFRLRDEVQKSEGANVTFYDFAGVKPGASNDEITKAYRKLSRSMHPDKARSNWIAAYNPRNQEQAAHQERDRQVHQEGFCPLRAPQPGCRRAERC